MYIYIRYLFNLYIPKFDNNKTIWNVWWGQELKYDNDWLKNICFVKSH